MKKIWPLPSLSLLLLGVSCAPNGATPITAVEVEANVNATVAAAVDTATEEQTMPVYAGNRLAGTVAPYLEFTQSDYDQAVASGNTIVLDFYANWCPICRVEEPALLSSFNALNDSNVVGFRVNYNDDDTDDAEAALADQFGVTYQHTKVIVRNGQIGLKTQNTWDETSLAEALADL